MRVLHCVIFLMMIKCAIFGSLYDVENIPKQCPKFCACDFIENILDCKRGNLSRIPQGIDQNVTSINLSFNKFNGIPSELSNLESLLFLDLSHNPDVKFIELSFKSASIRNLQLRSCSIDSIDNNVFKSLPNLEILNLSENPMTYLNNSLHSISLKWLDLSKCNLKHLKAEALLGLTSLSYFSISNNKNLRQFHCDSDSIFVLDISNCNLEHVPSGALRKVVEADLHGNNIQWLRNRSFMHLSNLENLNISYNSIKQIDVNSFQPLIHLSALDLSYNRLATIEKNTFIKNTRLRSLHMSHNYLRVIEEITSKTIQLLDLTSCEISTLKRTSLKNLPALTELHLRRNQISHIPDNLIAPSIVYLDLSYNEISSLNNESLTTLRSLRFLVLSGNKLTTINPSFFPQIIYLSIGDNPWLCDCTQLREIYNWMTRTDQNVKHLKCQLPAKLEGLTWDEACYNTWNKKTLPQRGLFWYGSGFFIMVGFLILLTYVSKKMDQHRKNQAEQQEEHRRTAELEEFIQRQQTAERLRRLEEQEESRNAPDPRELQAPPSYTEALLLPKLDASHPSLAGSLHSLASSHNSNPDVSKRGRGRGRQRRKPRRRKSATPPPIASNTDASDRSDNDAQYNATEFEESSF